MNPLAISLPNRLDFSIPLFTLPNRIEPVWSRAVGLNPGQTRLVFYEERLYLYQGPEESFQEVLPHGMGSRPVQSVAGFGPGYQSPAVLIDEEGGLWRWYADSEPGQVWNAATAGKNVACLGLAQNRLLVQRELNGQWESMVVDSGQDRILWTRPDALAAVLPVEDLLIVRPLQAGWTIMALDRENGQLRWQVECDEPPGDLLAAGDGLVWVSTQEGGLMALSQDQGAKVHSLKLTNNRLPQGVVDHQGIWHVCNGLTYQKVRLATDNPQVFDYVELEDTAPAPTTTRGRLALVLEDGRLIFADDQGKVFALLPDQPGRPVCWWNKSKVYNIGIVQEALVLLDWEGRLTIFG